MNEHVNFEKTPEQVRRELEAGLEEMSHHLAASQGHSKRGNSSLLHVFWAAALIFAGHTAYVFLVEGSNTSKAQQASASSLQDREAAVVQNHLDRLLASATSIAEIRARVAPSMPIDAQLANIQSSATDLRSLLIRPIPQK